MKKIISILLAGVLLLLPLISCGKTTGDNGQDSATDTGSVQATITELTVDGVRQNLQNHSITYTLTGHEVRIPVVAAKKSGGEGELIIRQATSVPGTATVSLNGVTYTIMLETDFIYEESKLQNTYRCLASEKKLNVAYIGGSVTVGAFADAGKCFRELTTGWLKEHFDADITETNAGIGGTGCFLGAYRTIQHLRLDSETKRPDLVFIDFAVNDMYDGTSAEDIKCYGETVIREILRSNPYADIVILIVGEQWSLEREETKAWRELAAYYGLPVVELTQNLLDDIVKEKKSWNAFVADSVHPNTAGHEKYASYIANLLQAELIDKQVSPFRYEEKPLPETTLSPNVMRDLTFHEAFQLPVSADSGFASQGPDLIDGGIAAAAPGATLTFSFFGTGVSLFLGDNSGVVVEYSVDGGEFREFKVSDGICPSLADGLEVGTHKITLRVKTLPSGSFFIRRILVRGNTERKNIKILQNP